MSRFILFSLLLSFLASSCGVVESPLLPGSAAAAAKDQIMLVRADPQTLGYRRLASQSQAFPDLGTFVRKRGLPDFLAETGNEDHCYFILYYLAARQAYACRSHINRRSPVEFSGPYPITDREYKALSGFREKADAASGVR